MLPRAQRAVRFLAVLLLVLSPPARGEEPACHAGDPGVQPPQPLQTGQPSYPEEARAAGVTGRVILKVLVSATGEVESVETIRTPYHGESLGSAAVAAVQRWRYRPARRGGEPVACWLVTSVEFYPGSSPAAPPAPTKGTDRRPESPPAAAPAEASPGPGAEPTGTIDAAGPPAAGDRAAGTAPAGSAGKTAGTGDRPASPAEGPSVGPEAATGPPPEELDDRVIRPEAGGPGALLLGAPVAGAADLLAGATRLEEGSRVRIPEAGVELLLDDGGLIDSIRYVFEERPGEFQASAWRTRSGLGSGSSCLGIPPAYGRPDEREDGPADGGRTIVRLIYRRGGTSFQFVCAGNRLVELILERG